MMNKDKLNWILTDFDNINRRDWYEILKLRQSIFVLEQFCPYEDLDEKDLTSFHYYAKTDRVWAYLRIIMPDANNISSIGRIISHADARGKGIGAELISSALKILHQKAPESICRIGAQCYLERFYNKFGFKKIKSLYLEDGIPHYKMDLDWQFFKEKFPTT